MFSWTQINPGFLSCFQKRAWHLRNHRSEKGSVVAVVVPKRKFVDVILEIFAADRMVRAASGWVNLRTAKGTSIQPPLGAAMEAMRLATLTFLLWVSALENILKASRIVGKFFVERFEVILHVFSSVWESQKEQERPLASPASCRPHVLPRLLYVRQVARLRSLACRATALPPCILGRSLDPLEYLGHSALTDSITISGGARDRLLNGHPLAALLLTERDPLCGHALNKIIRRCCRLTETAFVFVHNFTVRHPYNMERTIFNYFYEPKPPNLHLSYGA